MCRRWRENRCAFIFLGPVAVGVLSDIASERVAARNEALVNSVTDRLHELGLTTERHAGELERAAWMRRQERGQRRIDRTLLTENFSNNWNVREEASERGRQAHLLQRARRQGSSGRKRGTAAPISPDHS